jgi:hypothetical protein
MASRRACFLPLPLLTVQPSVGYTAAAGAGAAEE